MVTTFTAASGVFTSVDANFRGPWGVAMDANGNIVLADSENKVIRKITPAGVVTTFAGGVQGSTEAFADGTGTQAGFGYPNGVAVDASGNIIVADRANMRIRQITPAGVVSTLAGGGSDTYGYIYSSDGVGSNVGFRNPKGVAVDRISGSILIADGGNQRIRKLSPAAGIEVKSRFCIGELVPL